METKNIRKKTLGAMHKTALRLFCLLLIATLTISAFASCKPRSDGIDPDETGNHTNNDDGRTKVTVYVDETAYEEIDLLAKEYSAYDKKVRISVEMIPNAGSASNKMNSDLMNGVAADLVIVTDGTNLNTPRLISEGKFADIKALNQSSSIIDFSKYNQAALDACTVDGKLYFFPFYYSIPVLTYVKNYISDTGLKLDGSFSDFVASAESYSGLVFKNAPSFSELYIQLGYDLIDYRTGKCELNNEKMAELVRDYGKLFPDILKSPDKYVPPKGDYSDGEAGAIAAEDYVFINNSKYVGPECNIDYVDGIVKLLERSFLSADITAFPGSKNSDGKLTAACGWYAAINSNAQNTDIILSFLKYISAFNMGFDWSALGITAQEEYNTCIRDKIYGRKVTYPKDFYDDDFRNDIESGIPEEFINSYYGCFDSVSYCQLIDYNIRARLDRICTDVYVTGISVEEALASAEQQIKSYLNP